MKILPCLLIVLAAAALVWLLNDRRNRDAREEARQLYGLKLDSLRAIVETDSIVLDSVKTELKQLQEDSDSIIGELKGQIVRDSIKASEQYSELRETLTARQQEMLDNLQRSWQRQLNAKQLIIDQQEQLLRQQALVLGQSDSTIAHLRQERDTYRELAQYWERKANPSFLEDLGAHVPQYGIVMGVTAGALLLTSAL